MARLRRPPSRAPKRVERRSGLERGRRRRSRRRHRLHGQLALEDDDRYAGSGACGNVYEFVLYALDTPNFEPPDPGDPDAVESALDAANTVLDTTTLRAQRPRGAV